MNNESLVGTICKIVHNFDWPRKDTDTVRPKNKKGFWMPVRGVEDIGRLVIVNQGSPKCGYHVQFLDTGSSRAWYEHACLEYIRDATREDKTNADRVWNETEKRENSLTWHIARFDAKRGMSIGIARILDKKLGIECAFERNGEYYSLFENFTHLRQVIQFAIIDKDISDDVIAKQFAPEFAENVKTLVNEVRMIRQSDEYRNYLSEFK